MVVVVASICGVCVCVFDWLICLMVQEVRGDGRVLLKPVMATKQKPRQDDRRPKKMNASHLE